MVNLLRGEARIGPEGPVLVADVNALCDIMAATGETVEAMCERVQKQDFSMLVMRIYVAALMRHHAPLVTLRQAGDVISDDFEAVLPAIAAAFTAMLPEAREKKAPRRKTAQPSLFRRFWKLLSRRAERSQASGL